jgi:hypothetical protein
MIVVRLLTTAFLFTPSLAFAQAGSEGHEPNYLLGTLILAVIAAGISMGERRFFKAFLQTFGQLLVIGIASVLLTAFLRRLDIAFGDQPLAVLLVLVAGIVLLPKAIKRYRQVRKTDA